MKTALRLLIVMITSPLYCDEIINEIKTNLYCTNEIINLFE